MLNLDTKALPRTAPNISTNMGLITKKFSVIKPVLGKALERQSKVGLQSAMPHLIKVGWIGYDIIGVQLPGIMR